MVVSVINPSSWRALRVDELNCLATQRYRLGRSQSSSLLMLCRWFALVQDMIILSLCAVHGRSANDCDSLHLLTGTFRKRNRWWRTSSAFTITKQIIVRVREIVLQPDKYPEITFRSTSPTGKAAGANPND